jgi:hypothetical protein
MTAGWAFACGLTACCAQPANTKLAINALELRNKNLPENCM